MCPRPDSVLRACEEIKSFNVHSKCKAGRWARVTFKIVLSYHGGSFDGWQKLPGLNTVQGLVDKSLGRFVDDRKAQQLKEKSLPMEGIAIVAMRTDKGVTALQQVCSFCELLLSKHPFSPSFGKSLPMEGIAIVAGRTDKGGLLFSKFVYSLSCFFLSILFPPVLANDDYKRPYPPQVSRVFHSNFSAKWRRYFYIFPLNDGEESINISEVACDRTNRCIDDSIEGQIDHDVENAGGISIDDNGMLESTKKASSFSIGKVYQLLQQLEGKSLSYKMFARDTKAYRSLGHPAECFLYNTRATEAILPSSGEMVRVLVATAIERQMLVQILMHC